MYRVVRRSRRLNCYSHQEALGFVEQVAAESLRPDAHTLYRRVRPVVVTD